jgi:ketosteroid isomerase-like protein
MSDSPAETVAAFLAAAARGDRGAMEAVLDPQVVVHEAESLPFGGRHVGIDAFIALQRRVFLLWRETRVEVHRMIAQDDSVVVMATMHATAKGSGEPLAMPIAEFWRVSEGRIVEVRPYYFDTRKFLDTLGSTSG